MSKIENIMYLKSLAIYLVKLISCLIVIFRKLFLMFVHRTSLCVIFNIGVNTMFVKLDIRTIITNNISININLFLIFSYVCNIIVHS